MMLNRCIKHGPPQPLRVTTGAQRVVDVTEWSEGSGGIKCRAARQGERAHTALRTPRVLNVFDSALQLETFVDSALNQPGPRRLTLAWCQEPDEANLVEEPLERV